MNILLGFAPYIAFYLLMRTVSIDAGLWAALVVAVLIGARNWTRSGSLKVLEAGTVLIFMAMVIFTAAEHWKWTVMAVRLAVDAGLLAIVLVSLAIGRPFTLQYARERIAEQYWHTPLFLTINRGITFAWAAALATLVAAHAAVIFVPVVPWWLDIVLTISVLAAALRFTELYPKYASKKAEFPVPGPDDKP
jgi:hypothetical protein